MDTFNINEGSDGEIYTFIVKNEKTKAIIDLTNYTAVVLVLVRADRKVKYGSITVAFGTKASGEVKYTTASADPYPSIPLGVNNFGLIGQVKITGAGLTTITRSFPILLEKDYSALA